MRALRATAVFLEMVKIGHSIFALPFALAALLLAERGIPPMALCGKVVLAVVLARTAAMSFNRWADAAIDARNARTQGRAIPAGLLSRPAVLFAALGAAMGFVLTAAWINTAAFALSPVALAVLLGYSYTKRFTQLSHAVLGLALGLAPVGAWVAARGEVSLAPILLGAAVLFWTAGFDILYSLQDIEFDRGARLFSIPARWGAARALWISRSSHIAAVALLAGVGVVAQLGPVYRLGVAGIAALLIWEQSLVRANDLSRVNQAFFAANGFVSLGYLAAVAIDVLR